MSDSGTYALRFEPGHNITEATKKDLLCERWRQSWSLYSCYIISEWFFFLLSFFVGYILSFSLVRLRTIRLSAQAGAHIGRRCSRSCTEHVTITDVIIKTPDRKWERVANGVMPGSDGLRILVIFEIWDLKLDEARCAARLLGQMERLA